MAKNQERHERIISQGLEKRCKCRHDRELTPRHAEDSEICTHTAFVEGAELPAGLVTGNGGQAGARMGRGDVGGAGAGLVMGGQGGAGDGLAKGGRGFARAGLVSEGVDTNQADNNNTGDAKQEEAANDGSPPVPRSVIVIAAISVFSSGAGAGAGIGRTIQTAAGHPRHLRRRRREMRSGRENVAELKWA